MSGPARPSGSGNGRRARRIHLLLGVFFAPTIVFFAITGCMMVLELQSRREGRTPAEWITHVTEVHKHQRWEPRRRPQPPRAEGAAAPAPAAPPAPEPARTPGHVLLQAFIVAMGAGLVTTTLLGVWMSWLIPRDRRLVAVLLVLGSLVPAGFLLF